MDAVFVLLLLRAEDSEHADRAWRRMLDWEPARMPSVLDEQVNEALRLTRTGADPVELCAYDGIHVKRAAAEAAERKSMEGFRRRYKL